MFKNIIKEQLKVPAHIDYLGELRDFVTRVGTKHGFSNSVINAFKLSIDEACTNIIKHAYRDWGGFITLRILIKKNSMTVVLIDQGKYFDPARVKAPDLNRYMEIGKKGGLGIFIMRKLMDSIDYHKTEEGNELRLTKFRDTPAKKRVPMPKMSLTLKARYSLITSAILTAIIFIGYIYYSVRGGKGILINTLATTRKVCETLAGQLAKDTRDDGTIDDLRVAEDIEIIHRKYQDFISQILMVDTTGYIIYSTDVASVITDYKIPNNAREIQKGIYLIKLGTGKEVYDISSPVISATREKLGYAHIHLPKQVASAEVSKKRTKDLKLALLILLLGYVGIAVLIYAVMNPFQKLADWIRMLGHGEVEDEMDIDASDEIGEIAQAFSEITTKFRKSQENLVKQEQLQKEMQVAQEIQQTLLPSESEFPKIEGYEIGAFYEAAKEVGGDYFDFVEVDKDTIGIVVADVSGKGVPGSLVMTMIRTALRTEARGVKSASEVLAKVNDFVVKDMKKGMFVTVFYVIIDAKKRRLNYASAGHNPMILYRGSTQKTYYLNPKGFPIGISLPDEDLFRKSIESDTIQLIEDDILILYTDGITEAMNPRRELWGEERLLKVIREYGHLRVKPFLEKLKDEIHSFTEGNAQNDDITIVTLKEETTAEKVELKRAKNAHRLIQQGKSIREACEMSGITTYAYYNKYKRKFEEEGIESYEIDESISLEAKHLSIEEKTKIYDIIKNHPEYGAKRISEELNTKKYGFTQINEAKIYDELVRSRLNTRQLREAFVARGGRRRHMKPPGTPMLTLDGEVIIEKVGAPAPVIRPSEPPSRKLIITPPAKEPTVEIPPVKKPVAEFDDTASLILTPLEDILEKYPEASEIEEEKVAELDADDGRFDIKTKEPQSEEVESDAILADSSVQESEDTLTFEDLIESGTYEEGIVESDKDTEHYDEETTTPDKIKIDEELISEEYASDLDERDQQLYIEEPESKDSLDEEIVYSDAEELIKHETSWYSGNELSQWEEYVSPDDEDLPTTEPNLEVDLKEQREPVDFEGDNGREKDISFADLLGNIEEEISYLQRESWISSEEESEETVTSQATTPIEQMTEKKDALTSRAGAVEYSQRLPDDSNREKILITGLKYYREHQYDLAIEEFKRVIQKYPDFKEAHSILGNAYFRNRMYRQAAEEYQRVKEIDPYNVDAYENMGVIHANNGEYEKAIKEWEQILKIDPHRKDIQKNIEKAYKILNQINS